MTASSAATLASSPSRYLLACRESAFAILAHRYVADITPCSVFIIKGGSDHLCLRVTHRLEDLGVALRHVLSQLVERKAAGQAEADEEGRQSRPK